MAEDISPAGSGKYEIVKALGRGGMGEVYLARDTRLERNVAIKHMRGDLPDGDWQQRMRREAQLLAQLNHPNIVQIYDIVEHEGLPSLVMEYIDGRNLHIHLREHRVELGDRLRWLSEIAAGIAASHKAGIAHCDLKPENVLINPGGVAKVTDFGIASDNSDPADDMLALGVLADNLLDSYRETLTPSLVDLIASLREKRPGKRPRAAEAAEGLRLAWYEYSQDETPLPEAPDGKSQRSHGPLAVGLALAVLALAALVAVLLPSSTTTSYVAVAPTETRSESGSLTRQQRNAQAAVAQALRQNVIESPGLSLVSYRQEELADNSPAALLETLSADYLLRSELDCDAYTCEVTIERIDSPNATVGQELGGTLLLNSALASREWVRGQWSKLYPDSIPDSQVQEKINEAQYEQYLGLYQSRESSILPAQQILEELELLLAEAPYFSPLYPLYTDTALHLYEQMGDKVYLDNLEQALLAGSRLVDNPDLLDLSWFEFYTAQRQAEKAEQVLDRISARSSDQALLSFLKAETLFSTQKFDEADKLYAAAVTIQPNVTYYYALARNAFYGGRAEDSLATLELLLQRYPQNTDALNLKAVIQIELGDFESAITVLSQSISLQHDPLQLANLGTAYIFLGEYALANEQFELAYRYDSRDSVMMLNLADSEALLGNQDRARELYQGIVDRAEEDPLTVLPEALVQAHAQLGNSEQALTILKQYQSQWQGLSFYAFSSALVYTLAGQNLAALVEVDSALEGGLVARFFDLPWFDPLCEEQRFREMMTEAENPQRCNVAVTSTLE